LNRPYIVWEMMYEKVGFARFFYCLFAEETGKGLSGVDAVVRQVEMRTGVKTRSYCE